MKELKINASSITDRGDLSVTDYLRDVSRYKLLTAEEETELAQRMNRGDQRARTKLICANLRFVISVANRYATTGVPLADLIAAGNIGLVKAADRFDPNRGFRFISYAVNWIRQSILASLEGESFIRKPSNKVMDLNAMERATRMFMQEHHRMPTDQELSELADIAEKDIKILRHSSQKVTSLDAPIKSMDDENLTMMDTIQSKEDKPTLTADSEGQSQMVSNILKTVLKPKERAMFTDYMTMEDRAETMRSLADRYGMSTKQFSGFILRCRKKLMASNLSLLNAA